jgi:hypothetical protein
MARVYDSAGTSACRLHALPFVPLVCVVYHYDPKLLAQHRSSGWLRMVSVLCRAFISYLYTCMTLAMTKRYRKTCAHSRFTTALVPCKSHANV